MPRKTLIDFFRDFADLSAIFLVFDDGYRTHRYTYRDVAGAAARFAQRLAHANIAPGDKVVIWSENRPEWIACYWGCLLNGSVVVPVDFRASRDLVDRIATLVQAKAILTGTEVDAGSKGWPLIHLDWTPAQVPETACANSSDLCEIIFTSGATADPKGVTITHANILANIVPVEKEIRRYRKWSIPFAPIRFLNLLPLSHLFGQSMATFIPPVLPGQVVFMTGFNPREIVRQIHSRRISVLVSVPRILDVLRGFVLETVPEAGEPAPPGAKWMRRWWQYRRAHDIFGWKFWCFVVGAAPLDAELEEFWSKLGFLVVQGYGLTETAPIVTLNHPFHTSKGSVGKPIGGVEVRIAEDGEILVRGPNVTTGYFGSDEPSPWDDGWFHTGDIGSIDEEGKVFVRGRKKEMIVTPEGLNVFPEDVERILDTLPGVRESAVIGVTDHGREHVHAVLVLSPGQRAEDVIHEANQALESHQQIRTFSVWPEPHLPRTEGTQKLKRVALRDWVAGTAQAPIVQSPNGELLAGYTDETPLSQLGLSSLDRVELMMRSEQNSQGSISEAAFSQAKTVGELRKLSRASLPFDPTVFPRWNQTLAARLVRRISLPTLLLPLLRLFVWLRSQGRDNLRHLPGPVLFAVNHQSVFDVPTLLAALPAPWRYQVATAMGMDWFHPHFHPEAHGFFDRFGNHLQYYLACFFFNTFPIPQHESGARESLRYMGELVSKGISVLIFPEGVRTQRGEIAPFRPGVGMIGSRLNLKVVPVRIEGLDRVLPQGRKFPKPGRVTVKFGRALDISGGDDYESLARQIEAAVKRL